MRPLKYSWKELEVRGNDDRHLDLVRRYIKDNKLYKIIDKKILKFLKKNLKSNRGDEIIVVPPIIVAATTLSLREPRNPIKIFDFEIQSSNSLSQ